MIRAAIPADAPAIEEFLAQHADTTMFLRGNLASQGIGERTHPHGTTFYLGSEADEICGIGGVTNGGYVLCQTTADSEGFHAAFAHKLHGRCVLGMFGAPADIDAIIAALGCADAPFSVNDKLPLYAVDTQRMDAGSFQSGTLRFALPTEVALLSAWFKGFHLETGLRPPEDDLAREAAQQFVNSSDARVLEYDGQPVAMTRFNARVTNTVQIGGVYVPPALRGQGWAGQAVAQHLIEARAEGVDRAILFAASRHAARAYEKIGFRRVGEYTVAMFEHPWEVGA